ncbi:MAG: flavohemoprotein [Candidatus Scalindua sp.]|nr:NO-inducible flavohemoprotein [Planctomycetota bacterium]GJQ57239.1 MAG: flavohemoprotein [Candidatus Scalindua sp.]
MKLTNKTIEIIKATAPIVEEKEEEFTKSLYPIMFRRYPALKMFFNRSHLRDDTQPRAIVASIIDYANSIDNLDAIRPLVNEIAEKHASLNIKPVQYSIVIPCMLEAIGNVLGDAKTPEVESAWEEAMEYYSKMIIETETRKYEATLAKEGGWKGYKSFTITQKENESTLITSFYLEPADGKPIVTYRAGQYISIMLDIPESGIVLRNYSLSDSPNNNYYRISVKREEKGLVSNYLHNTLCHGDKIKMNPPYGGFCLKETDKPAVLISGGVGITPMMSILQSAADKESKRQIYFIHGTPDGNTHAFKDDVVTLTSDFKNFNHKFFYSRHSVHSADTKEGRVTMESIKEILGNERDAEFYLCGPTSMMKGLYRELTNWGVTSTNIEYEYFGPKRDITG